MGLIIAKDPEERRRALQSALNHEKTPLLSFEPEQFDAFLQEVETIPFLTQSKGIVLHNVDKLPKEALQKLQTYLERPNRWVTLYLTAAALPSNSKLVKSSDEVIRIKEEKPWEREKRLAQWVIEEAASAGVAMPVPVAQAFVKSIDSQHLKNELAKLICYIGEKREITLEAVQAVCTPIHHETLWQLGDAIFSRQSGVALQIGSRLLIDGMTLFPLLSHLRTQFHTTLRILTLYHEGGNAAVSAAFPYLKGGLLDKKVQAATRYGYPRLKQGLVHLFKTELQAKNSAIQPSLLLEILLVKVTHDTFFVAECSWSC